MLMNEEPRQILREMIDHYGRELCDDPRRCAALLKDHCGKYKRENFALINALENRVAIELRQPSSGVPLSVLITRLSKRLEDELGFAENIALWAVETWALAIKVLDHPIMNTQANVAVSTSIEIFVI